MTYHAREFDANVAYGLWKDAAEQVDPLHSIAMSLSLKTWISTGNDIITAKHMILSSLAFGLQSPGMPLAHFVECAGIDRELACVGCSIAQRSPGVVVDSLERVTARAMATYYIKNNLSSKEDALEPVTAG